MIMRKTMLAQQLNLLKYSIDYPSDTEIVLSAINPEEIVPVALTGLL